MLNLNAYSLLSVVYFFLLILVLLLILIANYTIYNKRNKLNKNLWLHSIADLINEAIFADDEEVSVYKSDKLVRLLQKSKFRKCLINELIKATVNLSGTSCQNLKKLYELLDLDKDSLKKLKHRKEHIKAKGLQELALMGQVKYVKEIFRLTNNPNELVRNEAQCALVNFYGFIGMRFLNVTAYPISQWQQIQLLNKLDRVADTNFDPLKKWLQSPNESVIIFSLKLAAYYHCNTVYGDVINCLQSPDVQVKFYALQYLKRIPGEKSADNILSHYFLADKGYKLAVLDALMTIGNDKHILFVQQQLRNGDDDLKAAAAKCLAQLHPSGTAFFQTHLLADHNPWKAIFLQIDNERAA